MLLRILFLIVLIYAFVETPFYKMMVVPEYKKFEKKVGELLYGKPQPIKPSKKTTSTSSQAPTPRPAAASEPQTETSLSNFMPKKSSSSGVKRSMPSKSSKKTVGWNVQN